MYVQVEKPKIPPLRSKLQPIRTGDHAKTPSGKHKKIRAVKNNGIVIQMLTDRQINEKYQQDIEGMTTSQKIVVEDIIAIDGLKAFRGGHVVVNSNELFLRWMGLDIAKRKQGILKGSLGSSHYPNEDADQYEIQLPNNWFGNNWGTVLFGTLDNGTKTWFQVEGHSGTLGKSYIRFLTDVLMHGSDFIKHKLTGENIGPFGSDPASEKTGQHRTYDL